MWQTATLPLPPAPAVLLMIAVIRLHRLPLTIHRRIPRMIAAAPALRAAIATLAAAVLSMVAGRRTVTRDV